MAIFETHQIFFITNDTGLVLQPHNNIQHQQIIQNGHPIQQLLIHWEGLDHGDDSWEDYSHMAQANPAFNLEDKVSSDCGVGVM